ncbi:MULTISPECIES: TetR/AcrR family transcriptional regulator [Bacillus]|uniref:TetR/AcrR family transcriptional regulator n=2 Tax=Bacillus TaxID=1386 RepID=A0AAJ3YY23_9BACI|nr:MULTISPECIES: TetR/AcrR family transcriptional regulator [Bacillus]KKB72081.1 TetR family transcriptional regulator [Bacillus sp. TH008]MBU8786516.1 TetR/AcrR family transcriptional regulator [Bacillus glycinifermentans]MDU0069772.1 TetR/AcrR family transcriptional regulator [Bacillus sp. IG6]MED8018057.1 TetR/AcrR family transcriptional regulator [Bacillus glycinifermentans]NUJ19110.1 TetR/AcrR family transcriptional regulator [Bacillus glycinifermentans]
MKKESKTKEAIVEAAFTLISMHGLQGTSLSMIAAKVGISKPAIYHYFPSKEHLIDHLFHLIFDEHHFSAYFPIDEYTKENFEKRLVADGLRYVEEYKNSSPALKVVHEFVLSAVCRPKYEEKLKAMMQHFLEGFDSLLSYGVELGVVSSQHTKGNAHILALVLDNVSNFMMLGVEMNVEETWELAVRHAMKGRK